MKRLIFGFITLASSLFAARIELHSGKTIDTQVLEFNNDVLTTADDTIGRGEIKEIVFSTQGGQETGTVAAVKEVTDLIEQARQARNRFPDAKGILLVDDGRNILNEDGTRNYSYHMAYLVLSDSRKAYATFRHYYKEGENEVKIHFARVIKPDGRVLELDQSTIRIETPPREDIVFFGKGKWVTFTLQGVEIGDIVEYSYEDIDFNPWNKDFFDAGFFFRGEDPFIHSRLTVDVPESEPMKWKAYNMPEGFGTPTIQIADGRKTYTWTTSFMEPYVPEPSAPPEGDFLTRVDLTNQVSWDKIYDWYAAFQNERMKINPEIQKLVDSLTVGFETVDDKIAAIYYWVQQNIRYISIKGSASSGVSGHPAEYTLKQGFGDCTDKAILFSTLLRAAGVDADPVYVGTNDEVAMLDPEIPGYYGNHCITEVTLSDTNFYLDATGGSDGGFSRYPSFNANDHGIYAVNAQKRKVELIPVPDPSQETREYNLALEIDEQGTITVRYQSFYVGDYETGLRYFWTYFSRAQDRRLLFEQMVKSESPDAELLEYDLENVDDISKQLSLRITYRIPNYVKFAGPVAIIYLPEIARRLSFDELGLERRKLPLVYTSSEGIKHNVTLKLPDSWNTEYVPGEISLEMPEVSYHAQYAEDGLIRFEDAFSRPVRLIQPDIYPRYRELLNQVTNYHKKPILARTEGGGE